MFVAQAATGIITGQHNRVCLEKRCYRTDGSVSNFRVEITPVFKNNKITYFCCYVRDLDAHGRPQSNSKLNLQNHVEDTAAAAAAHQASMEHDNSVSRLEEILNGCEDDSSFALNEYCGRSTEYDGLDPMQASSSGYNMEQAFLM
jgi:hypothetical protein